VRESVPVPPRSHICIVPSLIVSLFPFLFPPPDDMDLLFSSPTPGFGRHPLSKICKSSRARFAGLFWGASLYFPSLKKLPPSSFLRINACLFPSRYLLPTMNRWSPPQLSFFGRTPRKRVIFFPFSQITFLHYPIDKR